MFNREERHKLWGCIGSSVIVGGILCGLLFVWTLFADLWNCFCDFLNSSGNLPEANSFTTYLFIFVTSVVIGFIVGLAQALSARSKRLALEEQKRETLNQKETVKKLEDLINYAQKTSNNLHKQFKEIQYQYNDKKNNIDIALNNCKKKKEETESIMNHLITHKD